MLLVLSDKGKGMQSSSEQPVSWGGALRDDPNNGCKGDYCKSREKLETMLMQNFGAQTKSIMVFSEVAYCFLDFFFVYRLCCDKLPDERKFRFRYITKLEEKVET